MFFRDKLKRAASLTEEDVVQLGKCRRPHNRLGGTREDLLVVKPDETSSGLQAIKANPSKPSVDAMLTLIYKPRVIEATGVLGADPLWHNGNYQRTLFHQERKFSVTRLRELAELRR